MRKQGRFSTGKFDIDNPKIFYLYYQTKYFCPVFVEEVDTCTN